MQSPWLRDVSPAENLFHEYDWGWGQLPDLPVLCPFSEMLTGQETQWECSQESPRANGDNLRNQLCFVLVLKSNLLFHFFLLTGTESRQPAQAGLPWRNESKREKSRTSCSLLLLRNPGSSCFSWGDCYSKDAKDRSDASVPGRR